MVIAAMLSENRLGLESAHPAREDARDLHFIWLVVSVTLPIRPVALDTRARSLSMPDFSLFHFRCNIAKKALYTKDFVTHSLFCRHAFGLQN